MCTTSNQETMTELTIPMVPIEIANLDTYQEIVDQETD